MYDVSFVIVRGHTCIIKYTCHACLNSFNIESSAFRARIYIYMHLETVVYRIRQLRLCQTWFVSLVDGAWASVICCVMQDDRNSGVYSWSITFWKF